MKEPIWLIKSAVLAVHDLMIARFGGTAGIRDVGLFESALARSVNIYQYNHNAQIPQLAAAYAGGIIQNHPFVDGNKRTGFMAAYIFLDINGSTLVADEVSATAMTLSLAASEIVENDYGIWLANSIETL